MSAPGKRLLHRIPLSFVHRRVTGRVRRVDGVYTILCQKRELWQVLQAGRPFPGVVLLAIDDHVPAVTIKSLFLSAAQAGYPNVSFMVKKLPPHEP